MRRDKEKFLYEVVLVGLLCLAVLSACGCWRKPRTERPMDFVPPEADVIALLDYSKFVRSDVFEKVFDVSELRQTLLELGVAHENIVSIAGFVVGTAEALSKAPSLGTIAENLAMGVVVEGRESFQPVFKALSGRGWVRKEYGGRKLWVPGDSASSANLTPEHDRPRAEAWGAVALLRTNFLVAGTPPAVRRVLDVAGGRGRRAGGADSAPPGAKVGAAAGRLPAAAIIRRVGASGEITVAVSFSQEMRVAAAELAKSAGLFGGMVGGNMLEGVLEVLGIGRGVGLSFSSAKDKLAVRVVFVAKDPASAKVLAGLVSVAKIMIPTVRDFGGAEAAEIARGVHVWSEQNLVLLDFKIPESIFSRMRKR